MKNLLIVMSLFFSAQLSFASETLVLGIDREAMFEGENYMHFPCTTYMGGVFCGNDFVIEDQACKKTVTKKLMADQSVEITCTLKTGEKIELAKAAKGTNMEVSSIDGREGYVPLQVNPRVSIRSVQLAPGGLVQKLLVVQ